MSCHEVDYPRPPEDGPDCLPVADQQLHRPGRRDPVCPRWAGPRRSPAPGSDQLRCARCPVHPPRRQVHLRGPDRGLPARRRSGTGAAGQDRTRRRRRRRRGHRSRRPRAPGHRARGAGCRIRRPRAAPQRQLRLRRSLRLVPAAGTRPGMTGNLGYDDIRAATVRQVAQLMAASAITAPKSGGQLFLAGKANFMETVTIDDRATPRQLAAWMRARGKERRERIWFRDAEAAEAVDAILFVGLLPGWYPPNYDCGACGYATCADFLHHSKNLRSESADLEFTGPVCNLRDIDLGIAVGSAAKTAAIHSIDCRCQTRVATAARKLGHIQADHAVAMSLSMTHKAIGFDRPMPEPEFDDLDFPATGTQPIGIPGASRHHGARNRQARSGKSANADP